MMPLNVGKILRMKEMEQAIVLAGKDGLERLVTSATVLDAPDGTKWLKGNEFVFTSTYPLQHAVEQLDRLVCELADRNVAALGIKLNRYMTEIPSVMLKKANELSFPIIAVPIEKAWIEFINPILSAILNQRALRIMRSGSVQNSFIDALLANSSMEELARLLYRHLAKPISIVDLVRSHLINIPGDFPLELASVLELLDSPGNEFAVSHPKLDLRRYRLHGENYLMQPVFHSHETVGLIIVKEQQPFSSVEIDTLAHAKNAVSLKMMQLRTADEHMRRSRQDFLLRLLSNTAEESDLAELRRQGWDLGFSLQEHYRIAVIQLKGVHHDNLYPIVDQMQQFFSPQRDVMIGLDKKQQIVVCFPVSTCETPPLESFRYGLHSLLDGIESRYRLTWSAGISRASGILSLPEAYRQAEKALYHGLQVAGARAVQPFEEMGVYRLFSHPLMQEEIEKYVRELLEPLIQHDRVHQSNLVETLRLFLTCKGNYRETAKALYIHHNTVRYRLQLISKLTGYNPQHADVHFQYQLALLLLPLSNQTAALPDSV